MPKKYNYIKKTFVFDGKRYYCYGKTETEAIKKMLQRQSDLEQGKLAKTAKMTLSAWADIAIETYKTNQKEITHKKYKNRIKHCILDHIGSMSLSSIRPLDCQEVMNLQIGKSKTQINEVYHGMIFLFAKAVENGLLNINPAKNVQRPKGTHYPRRAITDAERSFLEPLLLKDSRYIVFALMLYCGLRPEEARNAKVEDIYKEDDLIFLHVRGTKTDNAPRTVPYPNVMKKFKPGKKMIAENLAGKRMALQDYMRAWSSLKRQINIEMGCKVYRNQLIKPLPLADDFVPYNLRHTYCTDLQKKGVDIRTAQYLMGHSDISLTANIYTHADISTISAAARLINA